MKIFVVTNGECVAKVTESRESAEKRAHEYCRHFEVSAFRWVDTIVGGRQRLEFENPTTGRWLKSSVYITETAVTE